MALLLLSTVSCTDEPRAKQILESEGYTDIHFTGHRPFRCFPNEKISTGFEATDSKGRARVGAVCCSIICSVRTGDSFF